MPTPIGQRNNRVRIEQPTVTRDSQGGSIFAWSALITLWANFSPLAGREALAAAQVTAGLSTAVVVPYVTPMRADGSRGISVKDRIIAGLRTLQVERIENTDGRNIELRLLCTEVQA